MAQHDLNWQVILEEGTVSNIVLLEHKGKKKTVGQKHKTNAKHNGEIVCLSFWKENKWDFLSTFNLGI